MTAANFPIPGRILGPDQPALLIAELSGNHNGDLGRAKALIAAAADAGADAVKLQTYTADTITMDIDNEYFRITDGPWAGRRLYELYQEASTPWEWHQELFACAAEHGLLCFSSPFDPTAVDFLESLACPIYKIASFEVVDIPLIERIAATAKPVIMSTGMANRAEIQLAVDTLRAGGCPAIFLLACVSAYPAQAKDLKLRNIPWLRDTFACASGLSDHSAGHLAAVAAVTLGAVAIEKHLTLARADGGPDAGFSMEPQEFHELVQAVRTIETALAQGVVEGPGEVESGNIQFRKSCFFARDLPAGHILTRDDIRVVRPGYGLPPADLPWILGGVLPQSVKAGEPTQQCHRLSEKDA
ncbi:MAG: pseudaminic acid synthase [Planctomycetota bacterium]|nr:MAG: pseudaminic acid synthase [Planctomycetota bacterium]